MSDLIKHLANYLKQELITSINTSPNDSLRVIFSAPPEQQLAGLFEYLIGNDECLILDTDQGKLQVPVYLVQQRAQDPTEKLMAARCTPSFLVTIRNYDDFPIWVALQEVGAASNASLSTAVKPLGIAKELAFDLWLDTPVISYLVEEVKATIGLDESDEASNSALRYALQEAWNADIRYKDKRTVWQLLQKLLDTALVGKPPYVILSAILGFPYASPKEFGKDQHLKLVSRISAFFQSHGLRAGFAELQTKAHGKDDLLSYLSAMQAHISAQNIIDAGDFEKHPLNAYCPIEPTSLLIPEWWSGLGLQEWLDLLGSGGEEDDAPETDKLEVMISNLLVVVPKGLQPLVRDHAELEISVKDLDSPVEVVIERSVGNQKLIRIHTDEIEPNKAITFVDIEDVPEHKNFIRYKVTVEGHEPIVIKLIILDSYDPGIIAFSSGASKASVFSLNNKARDKHNKKITRYESDLKLSGMGSHYLNLFVSKHMKLDDIILGYEIDVEHTDPIECNVTRIDENHFSCLIEVDEECHYEINAVVPSTQAKSSFRIYITAEESKQSGATSEFDRLVMMHRSSAAGKHSSPRVDPLNCRVMDLEMWILESEHSYRPLIPFPLSVDIFRPFSVAESLDQSFIVRKQIPGFTTCTDDGLIVFISPV